MLDGSSEERVLHWAHVGCPWVGFKEDWSSYTSAKGDVVLLLLFPQHQEI